MRKAVLLLATATAVVATPVPKEYEHTVTPAAYQPTKETYEQFWDNLKLCDAELGLSECLIESNSEYDFLYEKRIAQCTIKFVEGFCGQLEYDQVEYKYTKDGKVRSHRIIDNGHVYVEEKNCQTTLFADSFLVYQDIIEEINTIIALSPSIEKWTIAKINMALKIIQKNADCTIKSFFNYLNQCAAAHFISDENVQCVKDYLDDDNQCAFAREDEDTWTIPKLVKKYGLFGAEKALNKIKDSYHVSKVSEVMGELRKTLIQASKYKQGLKSIQSTYDTHKQIASLNVCPARFLSLNALRIPGLPVHRVNFHFPLSEALDPFYEKSECDKKCEDYFIFTKKKYEAALKKASTANRRKWGSRCFYITGYDIKFLESGRSEPISWNAIKDGTLRGNQCYKASWHEPESCSSHLTEWVMNVACCKSYHDIIEAHAPTPAPPTKAHQPNYHFLLSNEKNVKYTEYEGPEIITKTIDVKDLFFTKAIVSTSRKGKLLSPDYVDNEEQEFVEEAMKEIINEAKEECDDADIGLFELNKQGYDFGSKFIDFCKKVNYHKTQMDKHTLLAKVDQSQPVPQTYPVLSPHPYHYKTENKYKPTPSPSVDVVINDSHYLGETYTTTYIRDELNIKLNFNRIVPIVSDKCYPQACILSQLASCIDQPETNYENYKVNLPTYTGPSGPAYLYSTNYGNQYPKYQN